MKNPLFNNPIKIFPHPTGCGVARRYSFENGYGASVVRFQLMGRYGSYTSNENEWELGVLHNGELTYDNPITDDVVGHLQEDDVEKILEEIKKLPK